METRTYFVPALLAGALALAACGGDDEAASTQDETTTTVASADPSESAGSETTELTSPDTTPAADSGSGDTLENCESIMTPDELNAILGTSATISGSTKTCNVVFADDAIGSLQAFEGALADEAVDVLIPDFEEDQASSSNPTGVLLDGGAGFIDDLSVVAVGASGPVYRFDLPDGMDIADTPAKMQEIADLLLTR